MPEEQRYCYMVLLLIVLVIMFIYWVQNCALKNQLDNYVPRSYGLPKKVTRVSVYNPALNYRGWAKRQMHYRRHGLGVPVMQQGYPVHPNFRTAAPGKPYAGLHQCYGDPGIAEKAKNRTTICNYMYGIQSRSR